MGSQQLKQKVLLVRHGETEWSRTGRHTSITDLPLTDHGREQASRLRGTLHDWVFSHVFSSPRRRALETADVLGYRDRVEIDRDLAEWHYGDYEGMTSAQIQERVPGWGIFTHPVPGGEAAAKVGQRVDRVIRRIRGLEGDVILFSHGHLLRVFAARWIGLPVEDGRMFALDTATLNVLGAYHDWPAIVVWNERL